MKRPGSSRTIHADQVISGVGGALAIAAVFWLTRYVELSLVSSPFLIASMGASAVLLFAVPHGPMSQPWNVIGGHVVSAVIGVSIHRVIAEPVLASALAVGLAISVMYVMRCLHPPGGATAIIPVISGVGADQFGFAFALFPIGAGAVLMVAIATVFNLAFPWRRYPNALARGFHQPDMAEATRSSGAGSYPDISHADFVAALAEIDTFVDISEDDLLHIHAIAMRRHESGEASQD